MKKWEKPRLIVVVRGKSEERILQTCKGFQAPGDAITAEVGCIQNGGYCAPCSSLSDT